MCRAVRTALHMVVEAIIVGLKKVSSCLNAETTLTVSLFLRGFRPTVQMLPKIELSIFL